MRKLIKTHFASCFLLWVLICNASWAAPTVSQLPISQPPNCGITSTLAFAQMQGRSVAPEAIEQLREAYPQPTVSLMDVQRMVASLGFKLDGVKVTLDELQEMQRPTVIHLTNPDHFVTLLDASASYVRLLENSGEEVTIVPAPKLRIALMVMP